MGPNQLRAATALANLSRAGHRLAVSDLVRLECRTDPIRAGDSLRLAKFDAFFANPSTQIVPLTAMVYDRAAIVRATHGFKVPDALHLAAALESGCASFLTNDVRLGGFPDIPVQMLA